MIIDKIFDLELNFMDWLNNILPNFIKYLMLFLTNFGGQVVLIIIIGCLYWCIDKKLGEKIGIFGIVSACFNNVLKGIFNEMRPFEHPGYEHLDVFPTKNQTGGSSSFPSGHSQNSSPVYMGLILCRKDDKLIKFQKLVLILCICFLILIPLSRVILGVHFPHDVIIGSFLGILTTILLNILYDKLDKINKIYLLYLSFIIIFLPFLFIYKINHLYVSYGIFCGLFIGTVIEKKHINFDVNVSLKEKIFRVIIGLIILLLIKEGSKIIFKLIFNVAKSNILDMIRYFLVVLFATGIIPFLFKKRWCND